MYCPMTSYLDFAYLYKYYPQNFHYMIEKMREAELIREQQFGKPFSVISFNPKYNADYLENMLYKITQTSIKLLKFYIKSGYFVSCFTEVCEN